MYISPSEEFGESNTNTVI